MCRRMRHIASQSVHPLRASLGVSVRWTGCCAALQRRWVMDRDLRGVMMLENWRDYEPLKLTDHRHGTGYARQITGPACEMTIRGTTASADSRDSATTNSAMSEPANIEAGSMSSYMCALMSVAT